MQGSVFLQLNPQSQVIGHGRIVGQVGKSGDHWLVEYAGRPPYRRVFNLEALANFAIFANEQDRAAFLNPPKPAAAVVETPAEAPKAAEPEIAAPADEPVAAE
jgi:hypothetical protein